MAKVYLDTDDTFIVASNNTQVFGTDGARDAVSVLAGVTGLVLDQNVEQVSFTGATSDYLFAQEGNRIVVYSGTTKLATVPVQGDANGTKIVFANGSVDAKLSSGVMSLGGSTVSDKAGSVTPTTVNVADGSGKYALTVANATAIEGANAIFQLSLDRAAAVPVTVNYVTTAGTGDEGAALSDFTPSSGVVTFAAGSATQFLSIPTVQDATFESDETFTVDFSGSSLSAPVKATGAITNDDVDPTNAARTFTLTTGLDAGASFTGTSGDDSFISTVGADGLASAGTTFNSGDVLNGGSGIDTLSVSISGKNNGGVFTAGATLSGIENVSVTNFQSDSSNTQNTISLAQASGVTKIAVIASASTGDTAITGVRSIVAAEMGNGAGDLSIQYTDDAVVGTADNQSLTLSGQTAGEFAVSAVTVTKGIETLSIASTTAANTVKVTSSTLTGITVTGDQNLTLTEGTTNTLTSVNAKDFTGKLTFTTDDVTSIAVTGGSANDAITLGTTYSAADTIDGGAGTDTLTVAGSTVTSETSLKNVTGVETLALTGASTVVLAADVSATTFTVSDAGASDLTLGKGYTNATTVNIGTGDKVTNTANVALTVAGTDALVAGATVVGGTGTDVLNLKAASPAGTAVSLANLTGLETITIVDGGDAASGTAVKGSDIQVTTGNYASATTKAVSLTVDASALDAGTVTSDVMGTDDETINLDASAIANVLVSVNATGGAGADTLSGGAGNDAINGGAGNDTISTGNGNNTVDAGAGDDAITAGTGNDSLFGGVGNDTITLGANLTKNDTVDGGDGTDSLVVSAAVTSDDLVGVSNVENLVFSSSVSLSKNVSFTSFDPSKATGAQTITLAAGYTNATTVTLGADDGVVNTAAVSLTVNGKDSAIADADTTVTGGTGSDSLNITTTKEGGETVAFTNITGVETVTIVDGGDNVSGSTALAGHDAVMNLGAYNTALKIDASALDAGTVTSDVMGADDETINVIGASALKALNVTGGAGADTITGGLANDVINGGAGNDSINGSAGGDDSIDGGAGDDTINMGAALSKADTIVGGEGNDTLLVSSAVAADDLVNVSGVENLSFAGSLSFNKNISFTSFNLVQNPDVAQSVTFTKGYTNATAVTIDALDSVVDSGANIALTVSGTDANVAAATVTGGTGTADTLNITTASEVGTPVNFAGRVTGIEMVNVVDGGDNTSGTKALAGSDAVINLGAYATAVKVDASGLDAGTGAAAETLTLTANGASKAITVIGGAAADTIDLTGATGNSVIDGGAGNDGITAGNGIDNINGGAGNDNITFAANMLTGDDTVAGGEGDNTLNVSAVAGDVAFLNVTGIRTLNAAATGAIVIGTKAQASGISKVTAAAATDNTIDASSFSSGVTFDTKDGTDSLLGGTGDDTFVFAGSNLAGTDVIKAGSGTDTIRLDNGSATTGFGAAVTATVGGITGVESITVNDLGALDTNGDVSITFDAAYAQTSITVDGSALDAGETLTVDASANTAATAATAEVVTLIGGAGADTLTGGAANDNIQGGAGNDNLSGNAGNDTIDTGAGNNTVDGGAGNDIIAGGSGNDSLAGGANNDSINAGAGNDILVGGAGADQLTGGDGVDIFKYTAQSESTNSTYDTVTDFVRGTDLMDLQSTGLAVQFKGSASTGFEAQALLITGAPGQVVFDKSSNSLWMDVDGDGVLNTSDLKVVLSGVTDFAASDLYANAPDLAAADDSGSSNSDNITNNTTALTFTGINTASSTVEVFDDADNDGVMDTGEKLGDATVTATAWTYDATLAAGTHNIRSIETTSAGTALAASPATTVTVDTTAPVAAAATTYSGDNNTTITAAEGAAGFVITGTRETGATVTIAGQVVSNPTATTWSTTISPASVVGFGQGAESLTVVSTDVAGNVTNATVNLTVAVTGTVAATDLNTLDAATATVVDATNVTTISGTAAAINTAIASAGISTTATYAATVSDAQSGALGVVALNLIDADTSGVVTATVSGTAAELASLLGTGNAYTATVTDAAVTAAHLNTIDAATTVPVVATAVTGITGSALQFATLLAAQANVTVTLASNFAASITGTSTVAQVAGVDNVTTGAVVAANITDTFTAIAGASTTLIDAATAVVANGTGAANNIDLSMFTAARGISINGLAGNDTITGSDGTDIITGGAGVDQIDGGAGTDTYGYSTASDSTVNNAAVPATGFDTVALTNSDIFDFGAALDVVETATVVGSGGQDPANSNGDSLIAALNTLFGLNSDGSPNREAMSIQFHNGDRYIVADQDSDGAITATDTIIKITGVVTVLTLTGGDAVVTI